jgi:hypothetical protein
VTVLMFFLLIGFVFWITSLHDRPEYQRREKGVGATAHEAEPV